MRDYRECISEKYVQFFEEKNGASKNLRSWYLIESAKFREGRYEGVPKEPFYIRLFLSAMNLVVKINLDRKCIGTHHTFKQRNCPSRVLFITQSRATKTFFHCLICRRKKFVIQFNIYNWKQWYWCSVTFFHSMGSCINYVRFFFMRFWTTYPPFLRAVRFSPSPHLM